MLNVSERVPMQGFEAGIRDEREKAPLPPESFQGHGIVTCINSKTGSSDLTYFPYEFMFPICGIFFF